MRKHSNENGTLFEVAIIVLVVVFIALIVIGAICIPLFTQDTVTLTVTKTDTYSSTSCSSDSDGHSSCSSSIHNLAYTNGEILQFDDCLIVWVWGSQTAFSHIEIGKTYTFKVYGFNVPWLNMYRYVISYQAV